MESLTQIAKRWIDNNLTKAEEAQALAAWESSQAPQAWKEDLHRWLLSKCCFKDRAFGGVPCLYRHFCEWQIGRNDVPPSRAVFDALLTEIGFLSVDGLVYGLLLRDVEEEREKRDI